LQVTLTAQDLAAAGAGEVTVANAPPGGGTSSPATLQLVNPVPDATALSPSSAAPGDPRFTLTVAGNGFVAGTVVQWNGSPRTTTVVSSTVLHATVDPSDVATAGAFAVSVYSPAPGGGSATAGTFTVEERPAAMSQSVAFQIDPAHSGGAEFGVPLSFPSSPTWSVTLGGAVSYPLIAGGKVFLLTAGLPTGSGARLYALDLASGSTVWGPVAITGSGDWAAHAYENGKLFVLNSDGQLSAFDAATGTRGWTVRLPYQYSFSAAPTAAHGIVYAAGAGSGGTLGAISESDGTVLWTAGVWNGDNSSPAIGPDGVVVSYPCQVYKFDLITGSPIWRYSGGCEGGGGWTAAYADGSVYVRDWVSTPVGTVYQAFDGGTLGRFGTGTARMPIPAFGGGSGFFLWGGVLQRRDLQAQNLAWSFSGDGQLSSAPIVIDGVVVVGSSSGSVYAVDAGTGTQVWSGTAAAGISAPNEWFGGQPLTGLGAGEGYLVVPAGDSVTAWRLVAP
jgi:outer membrane protein assembly factor BamB